MIIIETSVFTRQVEDLLPDDEYRKLQAALVGSPDLGQLIKGSGGLRKVRWGLSGRGKSGGARVIYYWAVKDDQLYMLLMYSKSEQDDLNSGAIAGSEEDSKGSVSMKNELFDELVESIREAGEIRRGQRPPARAFIVNGPNIKDYSVGLRPYAEAICCYVGH